MLETRFVRDWFTQKTYFLEGIGVDHGFAHGQKLVYEVEEFGKKFLSVGEFLGHDVMTQRRAQFARPLAGAEEERFQKMQDWAQEFWPFFKKEFRRKFAGSMPVTVRFQIFTNQVYFYFFAQERYDFGDFVRDLREKVGKSVFIFQVSGRDMVRMAPRYEGIVGWNGVSLGLRSTRDLPEPTLDDVLLQQQEGRDLERMKSWTGRFEPSLGYESALYRQENKKFPKKWSKVSVGDSLGFVLGFNILTAMVKVKTEDGAVLSVPVEQLVF